MRRQSAAGSFGEELTAKKLAGDGWSIDARNWHSRDGELDIVASRGGTVAFVEVKTRADGSMLTGAQAVTRAKMTRLVRAALDYIYRHGIDVGETYLRFDVAEVTIAKSDVLELRGFRYIENAFCPADVGIYL